MSHDGRMRRGKISTDDTNPDRIYFLNQSKPKEAPKEVEDTIEVKPFKNKVKKNDN